MPHFRRISPPANINENKITTLEASTDRQQSVDINNNIVDLVHKNHTYYTNASDVPRSLQS